MTSDDIDLTIVNLACTCILFNVSNRLLNHFCISAILKLKTSALMKVYHSYCCSMVTEESYDQLKFSCILRSIGQCLQSSLDYTAL